MLLISPCFLPIIVYHWSGFRLEEGVIWSPYQSVSDQVSFLSYSFIFMPLQKQTAGSLLSGAGDDGVLQSLPKELLQFLLMKCCLEAFAIALTKEMISFFFFSHRWKNTRLGPVWQKHATLSPCPQITWHLPGAACWLGLGPPCIPGGKYTEKLSLFPLPPRQRGWCILEWFFHCWRSQQRS